MSDIEYRRNLLKTYQALDLDSKIGLSKNRIREWYNEHGGAVYVSFSGGKDSTVLLHIVRSLYPDVPAVFVDTGLEYPELRDFVKTVDNVEWVKPSMNFRSVIKTYGYPIISKSAAHYIDIVQRNGWQCKSAIYLNGTLPLRDDGKRSRFDYSAYGYLVDSGIKISDRCCDIMKKKPLNEYMKRTGRVPYIGTMAVESQNRAIRWIKSGCNISDSRHPSSRPLSFWTEDDVLEYLSRFNVPYASVYGDIITDKNGLYHTTGCRRTGCIFCGFGCHLEKSPNRFEQLKQTHPKIWDYCMKPFSGGGLGMQDVLDYIGVKSGRDDE